MRYTIKNKSKRADIYVLEILNLQFDHFLFVINLSFIYPGYRAKLSFPGSLT